MTSLEQVSRMVIDDLKIGVLIPTFNNANTLQSVIKGCLHFTNNIIVVNDGSTDETGVILNQFPQIGVIHCETNQGKGMAIKRGFAEAEKLHFDYVVTIDSDGQHYPDDIPYLINTLRRHPGSIIIGSRDMEREGIPGKSSFGNRFSNFWFKFDTGLDLPDTQSGYRIYPLKAISRLKLITWRFEFEVEILVKAAWRGISIKSVPVRVYYPPGDLRVSHFRPLQDFTRISVLNTVLFIQAVLYYIPIRWWKKISDVGFRKSIRLALDDPRESISRRSASLGFGVLMGIFPVWGYQLIIGWALCHYWKLNKVLFTVAAHISIPPMIPVIIFLSYVTGGIFVGNSKHVAFAKGHFTLESIANNFFQYFVGAVLLSIFAGIITFYVSLFMYKWREGRLKKSKN